MDEHQYLEMLDKILFTLSGEKSDDPGFLGDKNSIKEFNIKQENKDYPKRFVNVVQWDSNNLCEVLKMDLFALEGFIDELDKKGFLQKVSYREGFSVKILPKGFVFLLSGGYIKIYNEKQEQIKTNKRNFKIAEFSSYAAIASAIAAFLLLLITYYSEFSSNYKIDEIQNELDQQKNDLIFIRSKVDSLTSGFTKSNNQNSVIDDTTNVR